MPDNVDPLNPLEPLDPLTPEAPDDELAIQQEEKEKRRQEILQEIRAEEAAERMIKERESRSRLTPRTPAFPPPPHALQVTCGVLATALD